MVTMAKYHTYEHNPNRYLSVIIGEYRWATVSWKWEMLYLCIVIQKESHTDLTDSLRCKQREFSFGLSMEELRRSKKIREICEIRV